MNTYHDTATLSEPVRVNNVFQLNITQLVGVISVTDGAVLSIVNHLFVPVVLFPAVSVTMTVHVYIPFHVSKFIPVKLEFPHDE